MPTRGVTEKARLGYGAMALLGALLCAGPAAAEEGGRPTLWTSSIEDHDEDGAIRRAVSSEGERALVDAAEAEERLRRLASELGPDPASRATEEALRQARAAYVELRLGQAAAAYDRALDAMVGGDRAPADPRLVARALFERSLVRLAAQRRPEALADLSSALRLDPDLSPDPDVYGPPVFRLLERARQELRRARRVPIRVDRAPEDAVVRVDGREAPAGEPLEVLGPGPHLVTATRPGFVPRTTWVEVEAGGEARAAIVLERARGPLLALQALEAVEGSPGGSPLSGESRALWALALGIPEVIDASRVGPGEYELILRDAESGAVLREARGGRLAWEDPPFRVLAAALEGRTLSPPPPRHARVTLAATTPEQVEPGGAIPVRVALGDPAGLVRRIVGRCGDASAEAILEEAGRSAVALQLDAPEREGPVSCEVRALTAGGDLLARAPAEGEELSVQVERAEAATPWYGRWYLWAGVSALVVAGVLAAVLATLPIEPDQELVIHGP